MDQENLKQPETGSLPEQTDLKQRLEYLLLSDQDARVLRSMKPVFDEAADEFLEEFYEHLKAFPEAERFLKVPGLVDHLKVVQKQHLQSMLEANWNQDYVENRNKVGYAHSAQGVESHLFLGGFYQYVQKGITLILSNPEAFEDPEKVFEKINSFLKVIFLDIGLTLDAYFKQSTVNLEKALSMLWQSNAELKQFAHFTSHDLKTPLATVSNICEEILDEYQKDLPGDSAELVANAQKTVLNMSSVIDELLSTTSVTSLDPDDFVDPVKSQDVVENVVSRLMTRADQDGIQLIIEKDLPRLIANETFLKEVVFNLVSNAIKYNDKKPGLIHLKSEIRGNEGVLIVEDNGPGIPEENLNQIFSPFKRLNQHYAIPGSGLGLYYSRYLVEKQGGRIWVESEEGQGSRFLIALALAE